MKKRIFSLLLVLMIALSAVLVSCKKEEQPAPPPAGPDPIPVASFADKFSLSPAKTAQTTITASADLSADKDSTLFIALPSAEAKVYEKDAYVNDVYHSSKYELVFLSGGCKYSYTVLKDVSKLDAQERPKAIVDINFTNNNISVVGACVLVTLEHSDANGNTFYTHQLFNKQGRLLFSIESSKNDAPQKYSFYSSIYVYYFDGSIFRIDSTGNDALFELILEDSTPSVAQSISQLSYDKDSKIYTQFKDGTIEVYNDRLAQIAHFKYENVLGSSVNICAIDSDTFIIREAIALPDHSDNYEYFVGGKRVSYKFSKYVSSTNTLTALSDPQHVGTITSISALSSKYTCLDSSVKCVIISPINLKTGESLTGKLIALDENLKELFITELPLPLNSTISTRPNGAIIVSTELETYLCDEKGAKIASLPREINYNTKWFFDDSSAIYDNKMNLIYDFSKDNRTIYAILSDAIVFQQITKTAEKDETVLTLWRGVGDETVIYTSESGGGLEIDYNIIIRDTAIAGSSYLKVEVLNSKAEVILSVDNVSNYDLSRVADGIVISFSIYDAETAKSTTALYAITNTKK